MLLSNIVHQAQDIKQIKSFAFHLKLTFLIDTVVRFGKYLHYLQNINASLCSKSDRSCVCVLWYRFLNCSDIVVFFNCSDSVVFFNCSDCGIF